MGKRFGSAPVVLSLAVHGGHLGCTADSDGEFARWPRELSPLASQLRDGEYGRVHSFLVWRAGELEVEDYYALYGPDDLHPVYSVTKSITALAIGQLVGEGELSLDEEIVDCIAADDLPASLDEGFETMTVGHALTMRSGIEWDELSEPYSHANNSVKRMMDSDDWLDFVMRRELESAPGTEFRYSSGATLLLSAVIEAKSGLSAERWVARQLFDGTGIADWVWAQTPEGLSNTGFGLDLRPRDMVAIGELVLDGGLGAERRLVARDWIVASGRVQALEEGEDYHYGYGWWLFADDHPVVAPLDENDVMIAWGYAGQFIIIVPHLELVVASTASNPFSEDELFEALTQYIFPWAMGTESS